MKGLFLAILMGMVPAGAWAAHSTQVNERAQEKAALDYKVDELKKILVKLDGVRASKNTFYGDSKSLTAIKDSVKRQIKSLMKESESKSRELQAALKAEGSDPELQVDDVLSAHSKRVMENQGRMGAHRFFTGELKSAKVEEMASATDDYKKEMKQILAESSKKEGVYADAMLDAGAETEGDFYCVLQDKTGAQSQEFCSLAGQSGEQCTNIDHADGSYSSACMTRGEDGLNIHFFTIYASPESDPVRERERTFNERLLLPFFNDNAAISSDGSYAALACRRAKPAEDGKCSALVAGQPLPPETARILFPGVGTTRAAYLEFGSGKGPDWIPGPKGGSRSSRAQSGKR